MSAIKDTQATVQNVNFKIDPVVKESAESTLANMGLNMSAYIGMCLRQVAQDRKVPFIPSADPLFWNSECRIYKIKRMVESNFLTHCSVFYHQACLSALEIASSIVRNYTSIPAVYLGMILSVKCEDAKSLAAYLLTLETLAETAGVDDLAKTIKATRADLSATFDNLFTNEYMDGNGFVGDLFPDKEWIDLDMQQRFMVVGTAFDEFASIHAAAPESLAARFISRPDAAKNVEIVRLAAGAHDALLGSFPINEKSVSGILKIQDLLNNDGGPSNQSNEIEELYADAQKKMGAMIERERADLESQLKEQLRKLNDELDEVS